LNPEGSETGPVFKRAKATGGSSVITRARREESDFLATAVMPSTVRTYNAHFKTWTQFLKDEIDVEDPFMRDLPEEERVFLVSLMAMKRHQAGFKWKAATAFTAALKRDFVIAMIDPKFLESSVIHTARMSCQIKPHELRAKNSSGAAGTVKLPVWESILISMRNRLWTRRESVGIDMQMRMRYLGCMWDFEVGARVSEYTKPEPGGIDHCVLSDDLTFTIESGGQVLNIAGSGLAALALHSSAEGMSQISECRVRTILSTGKLAVKDKPVGRRSVKESTILDDIIMFIVHSGARRDEELLSCERPDGSRIALSSRSARDELKATVRDEGLPDLYFSSHLLRKRAITHVRALGASEDDRRERGDFAQGSSVMITTYDYAVTGLGPSAANSLMGGCKPTIYDLKRLVPAVRPARARCQGGQ
jgi:hypothetical protein